MISFLSMLRMMARAWSRHERPRFRCMCALGFAIATLVVAGCGSVPKTSLTEFPEGSPLTHPDDSLYAHVLNRAVHTDGQINLEELRGDTELTAYLRDIALVRTDVFTSRQQLLAFWINTHNAYVLDLIRMNLASPAASVDDIGGMKVSHVLLVGGKRYSLREIEEQVLTHDFREPRAFFALSDGSKSSPELRPEPFVEAHLSDQLDDQVATFLADSTKNYYDPKAGTIFLSDVFRRYASELDQWVGGTLRFVHEFAPDPMAAWIDKHPRAQISYLRYDETLNATPAPSTVPAHHEQPAAPKPRRPVRTRSSGGIN